MKSDVWGAGIYQLVSSDPATTQSNFHLTTGSGPSQAKSTHWLWIWENLERGERSQAPSFGQLSSYSSNWQWIKPLKRNCSDGIIWAIIGKRIYLNFLVFEQNLYHVYSFNGICLIFNLFSMMRMDKIHAIFLDSAWLLLLSLWFRESVWWCDWEWSQGLLGLTTWNSLERIRKYGLVEGGVSLGAGFAVPKDSSVFLLCLLFSYQDVCY